MKGKILNKKFPSLLGLVLILVGLAIITLLVQKGIIFVGHAGPGHTPKNITITNVSDNSFTASYITDQSVVGSLNYGEDQNTTQNALDDRDQLTGNVSAYKIHNITVRNLKPSTNYFFSITSGSDKFLDNDSLFKIQTRQTIDTPPSDQQPLSGRVLLPDGQAPKEGIVYFSIKEAQSFSSLLKPDGTYIIPFNSIRVSNLSSYFDFSKKTDIKMIAIGDTYSSNATISSDQISPVPTITLSNNYDFTLDLNPISSSSAQDFPSFDSVEEASLSASSPSISNPTSNEKLTDQQPEFTGTALPNETVEITIQSSEEISTQVTSDSKGKWNFRPATPLSPGQHTIKITTKDDSGIIKTITKSFTVHAAGTQVSESATPSATLSPSPSPTATTTLTPSPTPLPSPSPTIIAIVDTSPTSSASSDIPPTGSNSSVILVIMGTIFTILGGILMFSIRRGIPLP